MSSNILMYFFLQSKRNQGFWWKQSRICIHIVSFNGLQMIEGQNYSLMQFQRAINDTRWWIRVFSSKAICHLCFINTNAGLKCSQTPFTKKGSYNSTSLQGKTTMSDDFELGGEDEVEPTSSVTFSLS